MERQRKTRWIALLLLVSAATGCASRGNLLQQTL
jgi:hypothetical protein